MRSIRKIGRRKFDSSPHLMTIKQRLQSRLENAGKTELSEHDQKLLSTLSLEEYIYKKVVSKKFRKWSLSDPVKAQIKEIIHDRVSKNLPLTFTFPFGGYKLWRLPTAPDIDYAEFFTIAHTLSYLAPIAKVYQPGYEVILTSDEVIIERMNNIPKEETDLYTNSFKTLIKEFSKHLPKNAKLSFTLIRDLYKDEQDIFEKELASFVTEQKEAWKQETQEKQQHRFEMSKLNIKMDGKEPWHKLSKEQQDQKIIDGAIYHHAYIKLSRRAELVKGPNKIIIFTSTIGGVPCVPIGSTKASATKFWTGVGLLEKKGEKFVEIIYSPDRLNSLQKNKVKSEKVDFLGLKNLKTIQVIDSNQ
jgi:hypothetical protein